MRILQTISFLLLVAGLFPGVSSVQAQEIDFSKFGLETFTYRSKTFEKGHKISQVTGTFSLAYTGTRLIYTLSDRDTQLDAILLPDGRYTIKIYNSKTDHYDVRRGTWRFQNPFTIVTTSQNARSPIVYKDRLGVPSTSATSMILTINLRKNVHQKIYARRN